MDTAKHLAIDWTEQGILPDPLVRQGIRLLLRRHLKSLAQTGCEQQAAAEQAFVRRMDQAPIAPLPHKANEQHYELPPAFFEHILGRHRKYSCAYWPEEVARLEDAEAHALALTCERAGLEDGMRILELGCGWGSLTLWMAEHYPQSQILAVSNSRSQTAYILEQAHSRNLDNIQVVTCDMNDFAPEGRFARVVSVEMFEHMRNYRELFRRIHGWLQPGGRFFMHIFCHANTPYEFEDAGPSDWLSHYFFSAGIMPSDGLPLHFQDHLKLRDRWRWNGRHYQRTANAWLANMDRHQATLEPILTEVYGSSAASTWWMRWRMFFMACAELFGCREGQEWWVSHYLFERPTGE